VTRPLQFFETAPEDNDNAAFAAYQKFGRANYPEKWAWQVPAEQVMNQRVVFLTSRGYLGIGPENPEKGRSDLLVGEL
jgi:hypothetical protein